MDKFDLIKSHKCKEFTFEEIQWLISEVESLRQQLTEWNDIRCYSCREGWICEAHPDFGWPHIDGTGNDCPGPGMPCENKECIYYWRFHGRAALRGSLDTSEQIHEDALQDQLKDKEEK